VLRSEDADAFHYVSRSPAASKTEANTANIEITFVNESSSDPWPQQAKDAVGYAASIWAGIVMSQTAIRVRAEWSNMGDCGGSQFPLASAGPQFIFQDFPNAPKKDTWYPDALADALARSDQRPGEFDIVSNFNRSCGPSGSKKWHLGLDGRPPSGTIDLVSVALHEFAHGLGIFGSAAVDDGQSSNGDECNGTDGVGCIGGGRTNDPYSYDRFVEDGNGTPLLALSNPSAVLGTALEGGRAGGIFFAGPELLAAGFDRARLYAPSTFRSGASYAHVDENTYNNTSEALMTPFLGRAEAIHVPGMLACGILADVGWTIGGDCARVAISTDETLPVANGVTIQGPYPNPLMSETTIEISVPSDQQVRAELSDVMGRRVIMIHHGVLAAGRVHRFRISSDGIAPGMYIASITGAFGSESRRLLVVK
jgi:hypothetical protein